MFALFADKEHLQHISWCVAAGVPLSWYNLRQLNNPQEWIDDDIIHATQSVLKLQFPEMKGLRSTLNFHIPFGEGKDQEPKSSLKEAVARQRNDEYGEWEKWRRTNPPSVRQTQILFVGMNHWVLVTNDHDEMINKVYVYDSLFPHPVPTFYVEVATIFRFSENEFTIFWPAMANQPNYCDCAVYACAYLTAKCFRLDPASVEFVNKVCH